jgi:hypothetical protein
MDGRDGRPVVHSAFPLLHLGGVPTRHAHWAAACSVIVNRTVRVLADELDHFKYQCEAQLLLVSQSHRDYDKVAVK